MKLLTIHRRHGVKHVDFEIHDDGEVVVVGHDIESDLASYALGFEASPVVWEYLKIKNEPFFYFAERRMLGSFIAENEVTPVLTVSTGHITDQDDNKLTYRSKHKGLYEASGLYFDNTEQGYRFFLHKGYPPRETVAENKNKDGLSGSLVDVLQLAYDNGIYEVAFDAEGADVAGIEIHEW